MIIKQRISHMTNFTRGRVGGASVKYIVIHYTGNDGDTAAGNANYFSAAGRGASAHYFVDSKEIYKCVLCRDTAWHCGAKSYRHRECRNSNSIGVELCSLRSESGEYYFDQKTIDNAVELVKILMNAYGVPKDHVIRHFDVTGKFCPAPFVSSYVAWHEFLSRL